MSDKRATNRTSTGPQETSAQAVYRMVCEGDPVAIRNYLKTADPEAANHGILDYIDRLHGELEAVRGQLGACEIENDRLVSALQELDNYTTLIHAAATVAEPQAIDELQDRQRWQP